MENLDLVQFAVRLSKKYENFIGQSAECLCSNIELQKNAQNRPFMCNFFNHALHMHYWIIGLF